MNCVVIQYADKCQPRPNIVDWRKVGNSTYVTDHIRFLSIDAKCNFVGLKPASTIVSHLRILVLLSIKFNPPKYSFDQSKSIEASSREGGLMLGGLLILE